MSIFAKHISKPTLTVKASVDEFHCQLQLILLRKLKKFIHVSLFCFYDLLVANSIRF